MGEPISEGGAPTKGRRRHTDYEGEAHLCFMRCPHKLVKNGEIHECIMRRGHEDMLRIHICSCGAEWVGVDLQ